MQVWNVLHAARWKEDAKITQKSPSAHLRTTLSGYIFVRYLSTMGKFVKHQYLFHMFSQYDGLRSTNGWDRLASLGHPSKFQWVSHLGFVTAPTSLSGDQPNFAQCLANSWAGTLYIHFRGSCPITEFCQVKNSLCVQVLHSPILAVWLDGARLLSLWNAGSIATVTA